MQRVINLVFGLNCFSETEIVVSLPHGLHIDVLIELGEPELGLLHNLKIIKKSVLIECSQTDAQRTQRKFWFVERALVIKLHACILSVGSMIKIESL